MNEMKSDENRIREIVESNWDYLSMDKDRLVLYAVSFLESKQIEPTLDKITSATFRLFPKKFSLIGFPEYPDGRTIYYCVHNHCTLTRKWLVGNVQSAYRITERGKYFLEETRKMLEGQLESTKKYKVSPKRKEVTFVELLKKTAAYQSFLQNKKNVIDKTSLLEAFRIPRSSKNAIEVYLSKYLEYANRINDSHTVEFINFAKEKLVGENNA